MVEEEQVVATRLKPWWLCKKMELTMRERERRASQSPFSFSRAPVPCVHRVLILHFTLVAPA
jgi:hypothetical protein